MKQKTNWYAWLPAALGLFIGLYIWNPRWLTAADDACPSTDNWCVARITATDPIKVGWFEHKVVDGAWHQGCDIIDFHPDPPTIIVLVRPGNRTVTNRMEKNDSGFRMLPTTSAVLTNRLTHATQTVRITNRAEDTITIGTNKFWVVDIRGQSGVVLLKNTKSGDKITLSRRSPK